MIISNKIEVAKIICKNKNSACSYKNKDKYIHLGCIDNRKNKKCGFFDICGELQGEKIDGETFTDIRLRAAKQVLLENFMEELC